MSQQYQESEINDEEMLFYSLIDTDEEEIIQLEREILSHQRIVEQKRNALKIAHEERTAKLRNHAYVRLQEAYETMKRMTTMTNEDQIIFSLLQKLF